MNAIGGYLELELQNGGHHYHDTPYKMKSGRAALRYMFTIAKPALVYVPYYICNSVLEPFEVTNTRYKFYEIDETFGPKTMPELEEGEYFLYVNYLDLKRETIAQLSKKYKDKLIVDCTHSFFMKGNGVSWFFNSCRKFFGVPDGAYLYIPNEAALEVVENKNEHYIVDHLIKRFNGHPGDGYNYFQENEVLLDSGIMAMSKLSEYLLSGVDYDEVIERRRTNYAFVHERVKHVNVYDATPTGDNVSIFYPLLLDRIIDRNQLAKQGIFISQFWKEALQQADIEGFELEKGLVNLLWPLPIDQRYSPEDMNHMISAILELINKN